MGSTKFIIVPESYLNVIYSIRGRGGRPLRHTMYYQNIILNGGVYFSMSPYRQDIARHVIKTQKPCRTLYRYKFEIYSYSCCYYYYSLKVPWAFGSNGWAGWPNG